jgi:hypothetical protein
MLVIVAHGHVTGLVAVRLGGVTKVTLFLTKLFYVFFPPIGRVAGVINEQQHTHPGASEGNLRQPSLLSLCHH